MFFHQNIKRIRKAWGLSQGDIGQKFGVAQGTYSAWEKNSVPSLEIIIGLSDFFKVSIDDLLRKELKPQDIPERWGGRNYPKLPDSKAEVVEDYERFSDYQLLEQVIQKMDELVKVQAELRKDVDIIKKERQSES